MIYQISFVSGRLIRDSAGVSTSGLVCFQSIFCTSSSNDVAEIFPMMSHVDKALILSLWKQCCHMTILPGKWGKVYVIYVILLLLLLYFLIVSQMFWKCVKKFHSSWNMLICVWKKHNLAYLFGGKTIVNTNIIVFVMQNI